MLTYTVNKISVGDLTMTSYARFTTWPNSVLDQPLTDPTVLIFTVACMGALGRMGPWTIQVKETISTAKCNRPKSLTLDEIIDFKRQTIIFKKTCFTVLLAEII